MKSLFILVALMVACGGPSESQSVERRSTSDALTMVALSAHPVPFFSPWMRVSDGLVAAPGSPVTVAPWGEWPFAVFATGADSGIYTAAPNPDRGLPAPWARLPGAAAPGTPVTAVPWGNWGFALWVVGTDGGIYTAAGDPQRDLAGPWAYTYGAAALKSQVTAVPWGSWGFALFVTGTDGGIYTAAGDPQRGLAGPWARLGGLVAAPGTPVTAVPWGNWGFALFATGADGGIYTAAGDPQRGLAGPWAQLPGAAAPGSPVTALPWGSWGFALFVTGTDGAIYTAAGDPQRGLLGPWAQVSGVRAALGSQVSAVPWGGGFALYVTGVDGVPYQTAGDPQQGFGAWGSVASTTLDGQFGGPTIPPGATITAANWSYPINSDGTNYGYENRIALMVTGSDSSVYMTSSCCGAPRAPSGLAVTSVTGNSIGVSWVDNANDENGFRINYTGKRSGYSDQTGELSLGSGARTASLTGLLSGYSYTISLVAYNDYGDSSAAVVQAMTGIVPQQVVISLQHQVVVNPNGPAPIVYAGKYPPFGSVPPGHLLQIKVPQSSGVYGLNFVKIGGSTDDCLSSVPGAVVTVLAGQATTQDQMKAIYGTATPAYSTTYPIPIVACLVAAQGASIPTYVQVQGTIISQ